MSQFAPQGPGLVGTVLGGSYRITRLIGQGGMGAVYEGVQVRLERRVAIKLMARELSANPEAIARFRREAEVTSQLGHPHIVQVFDFGEAPGGEPYLVMEYLEGEDLEKRIQRVGRLPPAAVSHIVRQVSSALSATHAKGIVHRDLKPANVFLLSVEGETDFVKVVDFGISKVRSATTKLTAALAVMGTPNYLAPEQAAGRVNDIDARTDQWALACIAYELLAGRPPFVGEDVASLLYQVIHQAPAPLREVHPGLPGAFEGVLGRALSKTQAERFPTMTEFARAFEGAASGTAQLVTPAAPAGGIAVARAPTMPSSPGVAPVTTFSSAAGEAGAAPETPPVRPARRWAIAGVAAAVALGAGAFALVPRRAPATAPLGASASASAGPAPAAPTAAADQPRPATARAEGEAPAAAKVAAPTPTEPAAPASAPVRPGKKSHRSSRAAATTGAAPEAAPVAPEAAAEPAAEAAPPPPPPPPPRPAAAPRPAWPPPAWPPPPAGTPDDTGAPKRRPSIFKRMMR